MARCVGSASRSNNSIHDLMCSDTIEGQRKGMWIYVTNRSVSLHPKIPSQVYK